MFAADAVARLSGSVGVAAVTAGPGQSVHTLSLSVCVFNGLKHPYCSENAEMQQQKM